MKGLFAVRAICNKMEQNIELMLTSSDAGVPSSTTYAKRSVQSAGRRREGLLHTLKLGPHPPGLQ